MALGLTPDYCGHAKLDLSGPQSKQPTLLVMADFALQSVAMLFLCCQVGISTSRASLLLAISLPADRRPFGAGARALRRHSQRGQHAIRAARRRMRPVQCVEGWHGAQMPSMTRALAVLRRAADAMMLFWASQRKWLKIWCAPSGQMEGARQAQITCLDLSVHHSARTTAGISCTPLSPVMPCRYVKLLLGLLLVLGITTAAANIWGVRHLNSKVLPSAQPQMAAMMAREVGVIR